MIEKLLDELKKIFSPLTKTIGVLVALITAIGVIFQNIQLAFLLLLILVELVGLIVKKCRKYAKEKKKSHSTA